MKLETIEVYKTSPRPPVSKFKLKPIAMDHADLIRELPQIERMTNQERLKLAHSRRKQQLKNWTQYEKLLLGKGSHKQQQQFQESFKTKIHMNGDSKKNASRVQFRNSIIFLEAAARNDLAEVRRLLECGVSPDVANEDGLTALHQCCIDDNEEMMKVLFDFGVNVNSEDSEKWTPLHASATCGHLHLVKQLIAKGANLLAVNAEGNMPYDICDDEGTLDYIESEMAKRGVTQELIEEIRALPETKMLQDMQIIQAEGGDLEYRNPKDGATYLHTAAANGYYRVVELLLDNHVATDVQDNDYWQPIHCAACWNHIEVLELLVQNGADLNARTRNNETPYAICEDPEIKERIIQLRSEQETMKNAAVKKVRRSQSSNSRTQSIRRTSQRDKGLTSKRDVADEAQKRLIVTEIDLKDKSPSPSFDLLNSDGLAGSESTANGSDDPEDDVELIKSVSPALLMGRDSITQLHSVEDGQGNKRQSKSQSRTMMIATNDEEILINNNKNKLYNSHSSEKQAIINNPVAIPVFSTFANSNGNLPTPEINPSIELQQQISATPGANGLTLSGSNDSLNGGTNKIDIHVQVTINTNRGITSPPSNQQQQPQLHGISSYGSHLFSSSTNALYSPPGTLADLKKQRSLQYTNANRSSNNVSQYTGLDVTDLPPKYEMPPSPSSSLKRFTGDPGAIVGDYSESGRKCCSIV